MDVGKTSVEESFCSRMWGYNCVMGKLQNWEVNNVLMVSNINKIIK